MTQEKMKNLLFLDVETTGLEESDRLVQVAYIYNDVEKESLFNPHQKMSIRSMEVTHITDKMLQNKETFQESLFYKKLNLILQKESTVFVAHNAKFDKKMIEREKLQVHTVIDTIKVAQALDIKAEIPAYRLQYLRYYLGIEIDDAMAHDALGDVKVMVALFERLYDRMYTQYKNHDIVIEKMIYISSNPILVKRFSFGKYNGELVADIARSDRGYLEWLLHQKQSQQLDQEQTDDNEENWIYTLQKYVG